MVAPEVAVVVAVPNPRVFVADVVAVPKPNVLAVVFPRRLVDGADKLKPVVLPPKSPVAPIFIFINILKHIIYSIAF